MGLCTPWLWLCTLHGAPHTTMALALRTPWTSADSMAWALAHSPWTAHTSMASALHTLWTSAHSMASALHTLQALRTLPWIRICTLHGHPYPPMPLALHTSMGSKHSHRLYCLAPRRHIIKLALQFRDSPVQEAQRHVKPPPHDSGGKCELVGRRSA